MAPFATVTSFPCHHGPGGSFSTYPYRLPHVGRGVIGQLESESPRATTIPTLIVSKIASTLLPEFAIHMWRPQREIVQITRSQQQESLTISQILWRLGWTCTRQVVVCSHQHAFSLAVKSSETFFCMSHMGSLGLAGNIPDKVQCIICEHLRSQIQPLWRQSVSSSYKISVCQLVSSY